MSSAATLLYAATLCGIVSAIFGVLYHLMRSRLVVYALPTVALSVALLLYPAAHPVVVAMACCLVAPFMMARGLNAARRYSGMRAVFITEEFARALANARATQGGGAEGTKGNGSAGEAERAPETGAP